MLQRWISSTRKALPVFEQTENWLDIYFGGREPDYTPALAPGRFRVPPEVWELLLLYPLRENRDLCWACRSHSGKAFLSHMSAQAVGGAVGHNPISIIIPCHRVGSGGSLTGYAGGIDRKIRLLLS